MMTAIRTLVIDDEPLARRRIRRLLRQETDFDIVGESGSGPDAAAAIQDLAPDLVFLDVQMPGMSGLDVLASLHTPRLPAIVFVTAYDRYAVRAFEVHALDYLLKPFSPQRFQEALRRVRATLEGPRAGELAPGLAALIEQLRAERSHAGRLLVKDGTRVLFVPVDEIDWIEAAGNYVRLHVGPKSHVVRDTLSRIATRLDPARFLRIHRSTLVNADRIRELQPWFRGDQRVILRDGKQLTLSRTYRDAVAKQLGQPL